MKSEASAPIFHGSGTLIEQAEARVDQSNLLPKQANKRTEEANTRAELANTRTGEVNTRIERAENRALGRHDSELRYRRLFETAKDGILILDAGTGMIVDVNPFLEELLGYSHAACLGKKVWELGFLKDLFPNQVKFEELLEKGYVRYENLPLETSQGRRIEVEFVSNVYLECHQKVIQCNIRDNSERKRLENSLREQERLLTESQRLGHVGSWFFDVSGQVKWSEEMYHIYGVSPETFTPTVDSLIGLIHPEDRPAMQRWMAACAAGEKPAELEFRIKRPDGTIRYILGAGDAVLDARNRLIHMAGTGQDITERRRAEEELQNLRKAVEQSANTIVITDTRGDIEYVNPAFERSTGYTKAEALGQNPRLLKSGEQDVAFYCDLWTIIKSGKTWRGEFRNKRKDGSHYWESATVSPVQNDKGEILHFIAIKEDISEKKAMEASLGEALITAEAGNRAKSEFLSIMSHELRTPLNGVLGYAELLTFTTLDKEQKSLVETVSKCGEHLLRIIKDILDFSSIEAGKLVIGFETLSVAETVELSAMAIRPAAVAKALALCCDIHPGVSDQITGDALRIRQILINLLGNAVKFTSAGSVVLRIAPDTDGRFLNFSVEDTGIGMSSETMGLLFMPFMQADSTSTRAFGGTGLGLAISKHLAEAMGGSISVTSTLGKGSIFTLSLPLETSAGGMAAVASHVFLGGNGSSPSSPCAETRIPPEGNLVLVVEDDPENSTLAGKMLRSIGYDSKFAANGAEAVKAFVPGKFLAILMDVVMPAMNGIEATEKIRELEVATGKHVPIVALTANVMPGDRDRCLAAGMDDFLTKPFKRAELAAKLASVTQIS